MSAETFWRITFLVRGSRAEFRRHSTGVPGTKREAIRHIRKVNAKIFPNSKLRLVSATPDRQAEARASREAAHV